MKKNHWTVEVRDNVWELMTLQSIVKNFEIKNTNNLHSFFIQNHQNHVNFQKTEIILTLDFPFESWLDSMDFSTIKTIGKTLVLREYNKSNICQNIIYFENYILTNFSTLTSDYTTEDLTLEMTIQTNEMQTVKPNWMKKN